MEMITDIMPINDVQWPFHCFMCNRNSADVMWCYFKYGCWEVRLNICQRPECVRSVCEQVAEKITNNTFNEKFFEKL